MAGGDEYPIIILPKVGWRVGISGEEIVEKNEGAIIARRFDGSYDDCIDSSLGEGAETIKEDIFPCKCIPNLSTNLLISLFPEDAFLFIQKNAGKEDWIKGTDVLDLGYVNPENYEKIESQIVVLGWKVKGLDHKKIPYEQHFDNKNAFEEFKKKFQAHVEKDVNGILSLSYKEFIEQHPDLSLQMDAEVRINHRPTNLNYWHFTIDMYPYNEPDKPLKNIKPFWRRAIADNVKDYLSRSFIFIEKGMEFSIESLEDFLISV